MTVYFNIQKNVFCHILHQAAYIPKLVELRFCLSGIILQLFGLIKLVLPTMFL